MIDIGMGDWIKDYNGYLLMKFTSKYRYQQRFLDGKLFFNTSDFFARCDDAGRSDHHEGNAIVVNESEKSTSSLRYEIINGQVCLIEEEYANGLEIQIKVQAIIAIAYLIYGALSTSYTLHRIKYEHNQPIKYTGYCDNEGKPIPIEAKIFYNDKEYKVVKHEGIYRLLPYDEKIITSRLMKFEVVACDREGKLFIYK